MLRLDDFSLVCIFEYLNIKEQLIVSGVCPRFWYVIVDLVWKKKYMKMRTNDNRFDILNKNEFQKFFSMMTVNIQDLTIQNTEHLAFTNYLARFTSRPDFSFYLYYQYPMLKILDFQPPTIHDSLMGLVAVKCPILQVLKVSSTFITGEHIYEMHSLRELYTPDCRLSPENFSKIINNLKLLTHLDISNNKITPIAMEALSGSNIKYLKITEGVIDETFTDYIKQMRQLKILQIIYSYREEAPDVYKKQFLREIGPVLRTLKVLGSQMVTIVANHVELMKNLKVLHISVDMIFDHLDPFLELTTLTELFLYGHNHLESFLRLIENCRNLKHIYWECFYIHGLSNLANWIYEIIKLLEYNRGSRSFLTIHLIEQGPNKQMFQLMQDIIEHPIYKQQKSVRVQMARDKFMEDFRIDSLVEFGF